MCRLFACLGPPATLEALLVDPPHGLAHQAWAPEQQVSGTVNADGFGVGWYDLARRPEPGVHRTTLPMWADRSFASFSGLVASTAVVAAVRGATAPAPTEASGTPPFTSGPWLFAHNGAVEGFRRGVGAELRRLLTPEQESAILGASDSEVLFHLTLAALAAGASPGDALRRVVAEVEQRSGGRLNLVLTDGRTLAATRVGDSLWCLADGERTVVASEPNDTDPRWREVPDRSVVTGTAGALDVEPLAPPA
ncbi:MAG: ergothioneine biosynthesis protein EgtC [Acidimicrobiales bacterium]|nr:ergothioneine biosynthesis protein EgtC [Acidimicrobiales bacterium]